MIVLVVFFFILFHFVPLSPLLLILILHVAFVTHISCYNETKNGRLSNM
jgi:hypothetical protein